MGNPLEVQDGGEGNLTGSLGIAVEERVCGLVLQSRTNPYI
jgi:hypothetical protein